MVCVPVYQDGRSKPLAVSAKFVPSANPASKRCVLGWDSGAPHGAGIKAYATHTHPLPLQMHRDCTR